LETGNLKPWQIVVLVLGLIAIGFVGFRLLRGSGGPVIQDRLYLVDVTTGQMYSASTKVPLGIPAKSPETGERTLWPANRNEDGQWVVSSFVIDGVRGSDGYDDLPDDVINWASGIVTGASGGVQEYKR